MNEQEGVIKYHLDHQSSDVNLDVTELISWRTLLYKLDLINQREDKYGGLSYGNISMRHQKHADQFIISASQTGHLARSNPDDYSLVTEYNIKQNTMRSIGVKPPSSEALTHAAIYQTQNSIQSVIHVHSPVIWKFTHQLGLNSIGSDIAYGSVQMAEAVTYLSKQYPEGTVFTMLGHEDGVVVYGHTLASSFFQLIEILAKAIQLDLQHHTTGNQNA